MDAGGTGQVLSVLQANAHQEASPKMSTCVLSNVNKRWTGRVVLGLPAGLPLRPAES